VYLDRGVRTVQRWERELGLPVHRIGRGPRSPVHAFPEELQAWLVQASTEHDELAAMNGDGRASTRLNGQVANSRVLVQRSSRLMEEAVQATLVQRQRTKKLLNAIEDLGRRMRLQLEDQKANLETMRAQVRKVKTSVALRTPVHDHDGHQP